MGRRSSNESTYCPAVAGWEVEVSQLPIKTFAGGGGITFLVTLTWDDFGFGICGDVGAPGLLTLKHEAVASAGLLPAYARRARRQ